MLGKLVNKFKKHSLQEEIANIIYPSISTNNNNNNNSANNVTTTSKTTTATTVTTSSLPQQTAYRRSARISALYGATNMLVDSGTESDDDELEQLDSSLKRAPSRDIMGSSPPNLTSSPPLASEFDTNRFVAVLLFLDSTFFF
ncbi:unnamed protein product [Thelazia callipaeda]|uniref:GIT domain-containing protein n=1 Tax=Thelazia callipaeda TaxID=103827 RepID=A0A0N5CMZ8_THECL|nr:unnamed protein product [Thelazia callipaeda]